MEVSKEKTALLLFCNVFKNFGFHVFCIEDNNNNNAYKITLERTATINISVDDPHQITVEENNGRYKKDRMEEHIANQIIYSEKDLIERIDYFIVSLKNDIENSVESAKRLKNKIIDPFIKNASPEDTKVLRSGKITNDDILTKTFYINLKVRGFLLECAFQYGRIVDDNKVINCKEYDLFLGLWENKKCDKILNIVSASEMIPEVEKMAEKLIRRIDMYPDKLLEVGRKLLK